MEKDPGSKSKPVPDSELAVLEALWNHGPLKLPQIAEYCYPGSGRKQYGTVESLLQRLKEKGYVTQDRVGHVRTFKPTHSRDAFMHLQLSGISAKLCDGSLGGLVMNLLDTRALTDRELQEIRRRIDELTRGRKR